MNLAEHIRTVHDFPKPGIEFKDITTLLLHPEAFKYTVDAFQERYSGQNIDAIVAADARGFIFGAALAYAMGLPLVLVRKKGKLPGETIAEDFTLEYGVDTLEMHTDAIHKGDRVLLIDDLLATGGTVKAMANMVEKLGGEVVEAAFVVELPPLKGRKYLEGISVFSLVEFMVD